MPATLSYPGVYIQEIPSGVRTITGVSTSVTAFVGYTAKGVNNKPKHITSFGGFEREFGGIDKNSPVSYAVQQYFANGGTEAVVVRVSGGENAQWELKNKDGTVVLTVTAKSPGSWANALSIEVSDDGVSNKKSDFTLIVRETSEDSGDKVIEKSPSLTMDRQSTSYVESVVNFRSEYIKIQRADNLKFDQFGYVESKEVKTFPESFDNGIIRGEFWNGLRPEPFEIEIPTNDQGKLLEGKDKIISDLDTLAKTIDSKFQDNDITKDKLKAEKKEDKLRISLNEKDDSLKGESSFVRIFRDSSISSLVKQLKLGLENGGVEIPGSSEFRPSNGQKIKPSGDKKGKDGIPEWDDIAGDGLEAKKSGLYALLDVDIFNILCIPDTRTLPNEAGAIRIINKGVSLCEKKRAFYIIDPHESVTKDNIAEWCREASSRSKNAASYFPAIKAPDPREDLRPRAMAASGALAGIYARTDTSRGVWKAPAGVDSTLRGVMALEHVFNDNENGKYNKKGINILRSFPAFGKVVWGARTLRGSDSDPDEWKYIPVRRTALFIEESLYRGTQWVVFEPNDEPLWSQIRLNIGAFMHRLFRQGAFQGASPKEAYFVKCDKETTTQDDINSGIVNIHVGFAPLKPAEFVVISIQQMAGQIQV